MGCNCKQKAQVPQPVVEPVGPTRLTKEEIDWFNNIDTINPIPQTPDDLLSQELNKWNGGPQITEDNG
jgi:hypothetical protein